MEGLISTPQSALGTVGPVQPGWLCDDSRCLDSSSAPSASWLVTLGNLADRYLLSHCCCSLDHLSPTVTPWTTARRASLSFTISASLLGLMSIKSVMPPNHLILCHLLLLLPSILPIIRVFSNESVLYIRWPKYWSFSNSPSNECSGLISLRID